MRRNVFLAAPILLGAFSPARNVEKPIRIVVLGDSLARATGASRADGGFIFPAFRELLQRRPGSSVDSFAIPGAVVSDVARLQVPRLSEGSFDIVVVCAGANDIVRRTPAADFASMYAALIAGVETRAPNAALILCGLPDVALSPIFADDAPAVAARTERADRAVRQIARRTHADFIDFFSITRAHERDTSRLLSADRFHPSDAGYALLQREFSRALNHRAG